MADISVIVPTLRDPDDVACAPVFERSDFEAYELLVQSEEGASRARNAGIERASADKLVFLDDDSYPCEDYLETASAALDAEAAVAGRVVHPFDDVVGAHFTDHYSYGEKPTYVNSLIGCNMALRREVVETVGGFDEEFDWGHEEGELAYRISKAYDIYYEPALSVRHAYAESVFDLWRKKYQLERMRPLLWEKTGIPRGEQYLRLLRTVVSADRYRGETLAESAVKTGATAAVVAGRLKGLLDRADGSA